MTQTVLLGDLVDVVKGISYRSSDYSDSQNGIAFINLKTVERNGGFKRDGIKYYAGKFKDTQFVEAGDILIANTDLTQNKEIIGSPLIMPYIGRTACFSLDLSKLVIKDAGILDKDYLFYFLKSPSARDFMISHSNGSTVIHLSVKSIPNLPVILPSIEKQRRLASALRMIDEKIELNRKMNETLEQVGQALFRHYFITNPEAEKWDDGFVSELVTIYSGYAFKRIDFDPDGKYGLVTIKNVQDGSFLNECSDYLAEVPVKVPDYIHLKTGDVLLSLTGNVGRVCVVHGENLLLNQRVAKLAGANNRHSFAYFMFRQKEFKDRLISMSRGTAQLNLSPVETKKIKIKLPPKDMLDNFYRKAEPLFEMITDNYLQIQTLTTLRETLLPKLISGEIKV